MFLSEILRYKKEEVRAKRSARVLSELKAKIEDLPVTIPFGPAISKGDTVSLVAEVKKASPSKGVIREDFDPVKIARIYEDSLASAISILTDKAFFQGELEYLTLIREAVKIPLLRKDFIIDEFQIYEARAYGADAILLIAAILEKTQLAEYQHLASELGLDSLIEVHTEKEVEKVLGSGSKIIGINNRDLSTFDTDIITTAHLIKLIPDDKIVVSESGISNREDALRLKQAGVSAIFFTGRQENLLVWLLIGYIAFFAFSQGAVIWVYLSEVFPNTVRAKGQSLGSFSHWFMNALISGLFPRMASSSGAYPFVFFSLMMVVQFFVVLFVYPETKGVSLEEMQKRMAIS